VEISTSTKRLTSRQWEFLTGAHNQSGVFRMGIKVISRTDTSPEMSKEMSVSTQPGLSGKTAATIE